MARDPQRKYDSGPLVVQLVRGGRVIKSKEVPDYAVVEVHTTGGKFKRVKVTESEEVE